MKVIGLLGGMSWESSLEYYRIVNERTRDRLGGFHSAHCVLYSVDFAEIEELQAGGRWQEAGDRLAQATDALRRAGADFLVLCTNTMHKVADQLTGLPLLHLGDATAQAVRQANIEKVGLLGTAFTMEQDFYRDRLAGHGLDVLVPDQEDRAEVHRIIYEELVMGIVRDESRATYRQVIERLTDRGAEGVILGCTEIELLITQEDSPVPVFPTTRLHAELAADHAIGLAEIPGSSQGSTGPGGADGHVTSTV
jgi:aspartate racemase